MWKEWIKCNFLALSGALDQGSWGLVWIRLSFGWRLLGHMGAVSGLQDLQGPGSHHITL